MTLMDKVRVETSILGWLAAVFGGFGELVV